MRISDLSSDVCASDLQPFRASVTKRLPKAVGENPEATPPMKATIPLASSVGSPLFAAARETRLARPSRTWPSQIGILRPKKARSEEHTSELQSLMRISYAVFCLKKKTNK